MTKLLLDASALYPLILILREEIVDYYDLLSVLDLTFYEVGNAVWKEYRRGLVTDPKPLLELFEEVFSNIRVIRLRVNDFSEVFKIALEEGLTFYDAAYLYTARKHGLKLVTNDKDLLAFEVSITVEEAVRLLRGRQA